MAERKFDYNAVKDVYGGMKSINEQIKTLLTESDSEVKDKVSVVDEALYGDLGAQMLLNWENISSNFPSFMDNFDNWAALVSKASGNYQQFESDVAGFKEANPYGATSGGIKASFVSSSSYNNSLTAEEIEALDSKLFIYEEVDPVYIDTGMVHQAKVTKALNIFTDVMNVFGLVSGGAALVKAARAVPVVTAANSLATQGDDVARGVTNVVTTQGDDAVRGISNVAVSQGDDAARGVNTAVRDRIDDMVGITRPAANTQGAPTAANSAFNQPNTALQNQIDDMVGITRPAANTQGAPTINNSALANATDDQLRMAQAGVGVDSPVQQRIDALTGVSKPAASTQGAPTAANSAFNSTDDIVGTSTDRLLNNKWTMTADGKTHVPANELGAPTANNSIFADDVVGTTTDNLLNNKWTMTADGKVHVPANKMGAPTPGNSALASSTDDILISGKKDMGTMMSDLDDIYKPGAKNPDQLKAQYIFDRVDDGSITSKDQVLQLFDGSESAAKRVMNTLPKTGESNSYNTLMKMIKNGGTTSSAGNNVVVSSVDEVTGTVDDILLNNKWTMTADGKTHVPANKMGAPTANNSIFADDVVGTTTDNLLNNKWTMTADGKVHLPANELGAPTAGNSAFIQSTDDMIRDGYTMSSNGAFNAPASTQGAPTSGNSVFASVTDDQLRIAQTDVGANHVIDFPESVVTKNTQLQNRIDDMVGITRPAANTQGAPTAANSAFNQPNTALQNQIDDIVGITRPAASTQGAPTINNSALANATDDQLRMAQAGVGVDSPVQQRIDALTGVSKPAASTQGAPTVSDSAFYADNLGGKLNRFSNQVQAGTQNMKNTVSSGLNTAKQNVTNGLNNAKQNITNGLNTAKQNVTNGLNTAKQGFTNGLNTAKQGLSNGAQAARKGYEFSRNFAQEAGVANMKTVVPISSSGVGASATEVIRNEFINNDTNSEG